jgi:hypothetical protein
VNKSLLTRIEKEPYIHIQRSVKIRIKIETRITKDLRTDPNRWKMSWRGAGLLPANAMAGSEKV